MMIFDLIFGFLLIFAGRELFWLCVGIVGFLVGAQCAAALGLSDSWRAIGSAFALGIFGGLLAVSFEWFMVVFGIGFLGGGYLLMDLFPSPTAEGAYAWMIFVIGGIVGMCLMVIIFDWTLILMTSLLGATLVLVAFQGPEAMRGSLFIVCVGMGLVVQYLKLRGVQSHEHIARRA